MPKKQTSPGRIVLGEGYVWLSYGDPNNLKLSADRDGCRRNSFRWTKALDYYPRRRYRVVLERVKEESAGANSYPRSASLFLFLYRPVLMRCILAPSPNSLTL